MNDLELYIVNQYGGDDYLILEVRRIEIALNTAMETLKQIADTPRNKGARRNASATVKFLETQGDYAKRN
jgi:hypothetical protein